MMIDKPVINVDLKKYDKAYVVEDDMLWEVFGDGYSKAQVIWDKENICELLNTLHQENQQLQEKQKHITHLESKIHRMREQIHKLEKLYHYRSADLKRENEQLKQKLESIGLNEKNDTVKMIDGKVFIRI